VVPTVRHGAFSVWGTAKRGKSVDMTDLAERVAPRGSAGLDHGVAFCKNAFCGTIANCDYRTLTRASSEWKSGCRRHVLSV